MNTARFLAAAALCGALYAATPTPSFARSLDEPASDSAKKPGGDPDSKWDVNNPPGEHKDAAIDTREGTWMSLDLSPDGTTIAFDLLGDLYTLPITGGEATPITSGMAWDMQPVFSPDGTRLAFTSDRGGGDNIWVVGRDGSEARQITKESFRLLNQPAWTPDGNFIAARKHFTSRRSLGAGEIWLYHHSGVFGGATDGVAMTSKPTDQKDVNEPAFSPDGRYLYYTWDSTPGGTWEYNKDSNGQIFIVSRLDRQTGETVPWITGPGGAVRPIPSRDGSQVAFVRRHRFKTCLFVQDVATGAVRQVTDALERDMQETWSIHGLYPRFAWTRDDREIVLWSSGKIWRVNVADGTRSEIPFHVSGTRRVMNAVRFPVEVAPQSFGVKMLRSVEVSPKGDQVVFQALGHIYVRDLPNGEPRRLTSGDDDFEFFPSWSRDGSSIVYVSWNDQALGRVRVVSAGGGAGRVVTATPGHYVDPVFSPDGTKILYGKISGGYLLSNLGGREPGVYAVAASGGEGKRIAKRGTNPHFGASSDRVYLVASDPDKDNDNTKLISVSLDGTEERTHFKSSFATEMRVSPDGNWLAWVERYNVLLTPFSASGREIEIGPKSSGVPVVKAGKDAGVNVRFAGDSRSIHWSLGPELFTLALDDAFAKFHNPRPAPAAEPAPKTGEDERKDARKDDVPPASRLAIGFSRALDVPRGTVALVGGKVLTMNAGRVIENATVIIEGNRIKDVGESSRLSPPPGAFVLDCRGKTIMPGMIDVHAHGGQGQAGITPRQNWGQLANLAFGITTIHDPSNDTEEIFAASELQKAGLVVQPRTFSTGTILYGAAGSYKAEVSSLDDAMFHLRRMQTVGAFSVKSYNQPRRDQRQQVLEAARRLGMMVVPEGGALFMHNMTMVADGHTGIEHQLPVERVYADVSQLWRASATGYTPTLIVGYGGVDAEYYWYGHMNVWEHEKLLSFVPRSIIDPRSRRRPIAPEDEYNTQRSAAICRVVRDAGATVQLGAHGELAGLGAHWELWSIAGGGFTPMQALEIATLDGAKYLGMDKDLGSIEAGKLADILVLDEDPSQNIRHTDSVSHTILNGRVYDAGTMNELAPTPRPRGKFYFEGMLGSLGATGSWSGCAGCGRVGCSTPGQEDNVVPPPRAYR